MKQFREGFKEKIKPRTTYESGVKKEVVEPFGDAQAALLRGRFSEEMKTKFFTDVYVDILSDLFVAWLKTESHCQKEREFLYHTAMALGSVKAKMIEYEQFAKNVKFISDPTNPVKEEDHGD
jgi:hypothetical protein